MAGSQNLQRLNQCLIRWAYDCALNKPMAISGKEIAEKLIKPEISALEKEWLRQARRLMAFGFRKELRMTEKQYLDSLPKFTPQPENFKGRLDTPILVETRIDISRQCMLARIHYPLNSEGIIRQDWIHDPQGYQTPNFPYVMWTDEGKRNMNRKVEDVRKELADDERGGTEFDGVALYLVKPDILERHSIYLPGTTIDDNFYPKKIEDAYFEFLGRNNYTPILDCRPTDLADPNFGVLICGREK